MNVTDAIAQIETETGIEISDRTLRRWILKGRIPATENAGRYFLTTSDLKFFIAELNSKTQPSPYPEEETVLAYRRATPVAGVAFRVDANIKQRIGTRTIKERSMSNGKPFYILQDESGKFVSFKQWVYSLKSPSPSRKRFIRFRNGDNRDFRFDNLTLNKWEQKYGYLTTLNRHGAIEF